LTTNELTGLARLSLQRAFDHWITLDAEISWCDARIAEHARADEQAMKAARIQGIGPIGASAMAAGVGDFKQFGSAHQFSAWLGIVPRQHSSGGKTVLRGITRRGDDYLRTLLIQGARSVVAAAPRRSDPVSRWIVQLQQRIGWQKTLVAVANKNARILWAVLARGRDYDPLHMPAKFIAPA
jgi:transposase